MIINLITHYFPPEVGAPQARLFELAKHWKEAGHAVKVMTCFPNHPKGVIPKKYKGKLFQKSKLEGLEVNRHWVFATPNKGLIKKTLGHLSFMFSVLLFSLFRGPRPDVVVVSSPTFFSIISAFLIAKVRGARFVIEVRDLWPGIFVELGVLKNIYLIRVLESLELFLYRMADGIVPVTCGFKEDIHKRGIPAHKIKVITNGVDLDFFQHKPSADRLKALRKELQLPADAFIVSYIGAHGISHGLDSILEAAEQLSQTHPNIHFIFVGDGARKIPLQILCEEKSLNNVSFYSSVARSSIPEYYHLSDLCLVPLKNIPGFQHFIPSKMFEIMACGRPIVGALSGEASEILSRSGAAYLIEPEDPQALASTLSKAYSSGEELKSMGQKGPSFVGINYNRKKLANEYLTFLMQIVGYSSDGGKHEDIGDRRHGVHRPRSAP